LARDNTPLAHAVILHSSIPEISEECSMFYTLCAIVPGYCGLGV
jgi:hypothetical protein